jgi:hypothetical protein
MDAVLDGSLTAAKLAKLLPAAATARMVGQYRQELARDSEHILVGQWHRELAAGGAGQILDSLRPQFDKHAAAIAHARSLFTAESTPEHVLASGEPGTIEAWQSLDGHLRVVAKIGAIASQFGCRPTAQFPQIVEFVAADTFRITDAAVMCTAGNLVTDSALFGQPDQGHRTSPWARTTLKLHTIDEARERYRQWASAEWERIHSGPRGGWIDEHGKMHEHPKPANPYAPVEVST